MGRCAMCKLRHDSTWGVPDALLYNVNYYDSNKWSHINEIFWTERIMTIQQKNMTENVKLSCVVIFCKTSEWWCILITGSIQFGGKDNSAHIFFL